MFTFIAGATSTGAVVARYIVVRKSSAIAMRKLGQNIRRRRSHHQRLSPLRLANVLNPVLLAGGLACAASRLRPTGW